MRDKITIKDVVTNKLYHFDTLEQSCDFIDEHPNPDWLVYVEQQ